MGFSEPVAQNEDNSRYFTASFGLSSNHQPTQGYPEQSSDESSSSSSSDSSSQPEQDSSDSDEEEKIPQGFKEERSPISGFLTKSKKRKDQYHGVENFEAANQASNWHPREENKPEFAMDRVQSSHQPNRGGRFGRKKQGMGDLEQVDVYSLIANNSQIKRELDEEAQGFALHYANQKDFELIKLCIEYNKTQDGNTFVNEVAEYMKEQANQFYDQEFTEEELTKLHNLNENSELDSIFTTFARSGNVATFKNHLKQVLEPVQPRKPTSVLGTLQNSVSKPLQMPKPSQPRA